MRHVEFLLGSGKKRWEAPATFPTYVLLEELRKFHGNDWSTSVAAGSINLTKGKVIPVDQSQTLKIDLQNVSLSLCWDNEISLCEKKFDFVNDLCFASYWTSKEVCWQFVKDKYSCVHSYQLELFSWYWLWLYSWRVKPRSLT